MPPWVGTAAEYSMVFTAVDHISSVLDGIGNAMAGIVTTTANFQTSLNQLQSNTTLTAANMDQIRKAVLDLNAQSGAPLDQLTTGFMRVADVGNSVADSITIMHAAMESALPTGASVADVAGVLALQMHDFGIQAGMATNVMNVLHLSSAESRTNLQDFADSTAKATTMAANLGLPLVQVDAALAALTLHMGSASEASTALSGFFSKLAAPTGVAEKALAQLSATSHIDLVNDFTAVGLQAKGLPAVMKDLETATHGNVQEMLKLVPAMRGGIAEMVLLGTGSADYTRILKDLNAAMEGQTNATLPAYQQYLHSFNGEMAQLSAAATQLTMDIGQPIVNGLIPVMNDLVTWETAHKTQIVAFGDALGKDVEKGITSLVTYTMAHQTDIENFVKAFTGDIVTDLPKVVDGFTNLATAVAGLGAQITPLLPALQKYIDFAGAYMSVQGTIIHGALDLTGGAASAAGSAVNAALGGSIPHVAHAAQVAGVGASGGWSPATGWAVPAGWISIGGIGGGGGPQTAAQAALVGPPGGGGPQTLGEAIAAGLVHAGGGPQTAAQAAAAAQAYANLHAQTARGGGGPQNQAQSDAATAAYQWIEAQKAQHAQDLANLKAQMDQISQQQAQKALTTAQQQLQIDILKNAPQVTLLGDIKTILTDFSAPILGNSPTAIQLEQLQLQQQITKAATATATHTAAIATNWRVFAPYQSASEGSTIAAYGFGGGQNAQAQMIAALREQISHLLTQNALITRLLTSSQRQELAAEDTSRNTDKMATSLGNLDRKAGTPVQAQNPLAGHGLTTSGRK